MSDEREIVSTLRAVAAADCRRQAPEHVERVVRAAFRARWSSARPRTRWRLRLAWALAATTAAACAMLMYPPPERPVAVSRTPRQFIALPYGAGLSPREAAAIIRVRIPRAALFSMGIPVNPERSSGTVEADLLCGEDGLARAIRLVY